MDASKSKKIGTKQRKRRRRNLRW